MPLHGVAADGAAEGGSHGQTPAHAQRGAARGAPSDTPEQKKFHVRSASHGGIMVKREFHTLEYGAAPPTSGAIPSSTTGAYPGGGVLVGGARGRGHQRTFSHGQLGHRRVGSKTEFILPEGHEEREKERAAKGSTLGRGTASPLKGHSRQASRSESIYTIREHKKTLLQKIMFWKKDPDEGSTRSVVANHVVPPHVPKSQHPNGMYPSNRICTTKYTLFSFIPKNLFEQFHRFANLYFLFIVLLNFVPAVNAYGKEVAMLPLVFVLGITAIKDAFEDRRRYLSDQRVNHSTCRVYDRDQDRYVKRKWQDVQVGAIIHLSCNEVIPADMVVLNSSDEHGTCYIESSNLDGESNLKQRQCVKGLGMDHKFEVSKFDYVLEIGPPSTKIYHFSGSIPLSSGERIPLTKDNLLLRDCMLRNTNFIEGIVVYAGSETKAMLNNGGTRYKRSHLEKLMNTEIICCVVILIVMCLASATGSGLWNNYYASNDTAGGVPFLVPDGLDLDTGEMYTSSSSPIWTAFLSFWTFIILYQVIIPISLYVTIEIIKLMQVYHIHRDHHFKDKASGKTIECRALNITEELGQVQYIFTDKTGTLTENNMVFQRCSINGVDYSHTPVIVDRKIDNSTSRDTFLINNQLQEEVNNLELPRIYAQPNSRQPQPQPTHDQDAQKMIDFFMTLAACNTVIVAKHPHKDQMNASGMIIPPENDPDHDTSANHSSSSFGNLANFNMPNLGGSTRLLKSILTFPRPLSPIASSPNTTPPHTPPDGSPRPNINSPLGVDSSFTSANSNLNRTPRSNKQKGDIQLLTPPSSNLSVSYSPDSTNVTRPNVLNIETHNGYLIPTSTLTTPTPSPMDVKPIYEAESPDELALVDAANKYGCRLLRRSIHNVLVFLPGSGLVEFEVLHILPFDSNRKRMSIIVRHPVTREVTLYCKGADSAILDYLSRNIDDRGKLNVFKTQQHLNIYSKKGLRVLCMAKRTLTEEQYQNWAVKQKEAENCLSDREHKLQQSYRRIEKELILVGATGIEDRLQDGVPQTIRQLRDAGIIIWVLTGDKQETAINIAYSCQLFNSDMEILKLNTRTKDQAENTIQFYLNQIEQEEERWQRYIQSQSTLGYSTTTTTFIQHSNNQDGNNSTAEEEPKVKKPKEKGLVVDGRTLVYILDRRANLRKAFLTLAGKCGSVLCCRATPLQKSLIVRSAKDTLKVRTLAVGDGANDVSMIQTADVGIGISGQEGRQAVMASDFAIARFRHLEKLLLIHGHWCYDRLARTILYFFYKNASFVFLLMWYQMFCGYSGSSMIDQMYLIVFNLFFTSIPPFAVGIYDKDAPEDILLLKPELYAQGRLGKLYRPQYFWVNILDALYQSFVIFFFPAYLYLDSSVGMYEFGMTLTHACLVAQSLHLAIETKAWTVIHVGAIIVSFLLFYLFGILYTMTCTACFGIVSQYGQLENAFTSPSQWFTVILTSVVAVLPRFVINSLITSICPNEVLQAVLEHQAKKKAQGSVSSWSRCSSSTASSSSRIEREKKS